MRTVCTRFTSSVLRHFLVGAGQHAPPPAAAADIVDQHIDSAMRAHRRIHQAGGVVRPGDIGDHRRDRGRRRAQPLRRTLQVGLATGGDHHVAAFRGETRGGCKTDAAAGAGDQCDAAGETEIHRGFLS